MTTTVLIYFQCQATVRSTWVYRKDMLGQLLAICLGPMSVTAFAFYFVAFRWANSRGLHMQLGVAACWPLLKLATKFAMTRLLRMSSAVNMTPYGNLAVDAMFAFGENILFTSVRDWNVVLMLVACDVAENLGKCMIAVREFSASLVERISESSDKSDILSHRDVKACAYLMELFMCEFAEIVVAATNLLVLAFLWHGPNSQLTNLTRDHREEDIRTICLYLSFEIIVEAVLFWLLRGFARGAMGGLDVWKFGVTYFREMNLSLPLVLMVCFVDILCVANTFDEFNGLIKVVKLLGIETVDGPTLRL